MNLSEEDKKRIQEEEEYRETLRAKHAEESKYRQGIIAKKSKGKSVFYFITHLFKWWIIVGLIIFIIGLISFIAGNWSSSSNIQNSASTSISKEQSVSDIEVNGQKVSVGDSADSVFELITERYKQDSPTVKEGKVTHHFLIGNTLYDMTFERNETGDYYILSKIVIIDSNYQTPTNTQSSPSPVQYAIGYTSGYLVTIAVPKGTSRDELINLLNYFHNLHQKGELSKTMKGHTIISIFDDEQWVVEENYNRIVKDGSFCDHVIALYGVDSDGKESAFIGDNNCPNSEEVTF